MSTLPNVDEILASGDPDQMEQLLNSLDGEQVVDSGDDVNLDEVPEELSDEDELVEVDDDLIAEAKAMGIEISPKDEPAPAPEVPKEPAPQEPAPAANQPAAEEGEPVILSKDGKHTIPYEELATAREQLGRTTAELNEFKDKFNQLNEQLTQNQRLLGLRDEQLQQAGIKARDLPENLELTPEKRAALLQEWGEAGEVIIGVYEQNKLLRQQLEDRLAAQSQAPQQPAQEDPKVADRTAVQSAIDANKDLSAWQQGDRERFDFAVDIDQRLKNDPAFQNKPYSERFAEVVRRTKAAFGDPLDPPTLARTPTATKEELAAKAEKAIEKATPSTPPSLSDIANSNSDADKPLVQRLAEMNPDQLADAMAGMTSQQIDALLWGQ